MTFLEGHPGSLGKKGEVNGQEVVTKRQQPWEGMGDKSDPTYPPLPSPLPLLPDPFGTLSCSSPTPGILPGGGCYGSPLSLPRWVLGVGGKMEMLNGDNSPQVTSAVVKARWGRVGTPGAAAWRTGRSHNLVGTSPE